jgi:hypothetical protein
LSARWCTRVQELSRTRHRKLMRLGRQRFIGRHTFAADADVDANPNFSD